MPPPVRVNRSVVVPAPLAEVWDRVVSPEGINHELRPVLTMEMPARWRHATIATVPTGVDLGRAWLRLGGIVPVEYDDLHLVEVSAPHHFHERSVMLSARVWEHRRTLEELADRSTRVTDELAMVPRVPLPAALVRRVIDGVFAHRHRRLRAWGQRRCSRPNPI